MCSPGSPTSKKAGDVLPENKPASGNERDERSGDEDCSIAER